MKVLIIGNDSNRLDITISIVKSFFKSAKIVHIDNFNEAYKVCYRKKDINKFNLIILDMEFCRAKPYKGTNPTKHKWTGCMFLSHLAERECNIPVIVYSSEDDYMERYKTYLFPSFEKFCDHYDSHPISIEGSDVGKLYDEVISVATKILENSHFIIGGVRTTQELKNIIHTHWNIMEKAG